MTAEMHSLANDPNFVVEFAVGEPFPELVPQQKGSGIVFSGLYFNQPKRYIMKKAHMSREDVRILDVDNGRVVMVSHHPGKNPYEKMDPLGLGNTGKRYEKHGGEWESATDVTSRQRGMQSFKIRPKTLSRHGRQYIKRTNNDTVFNIGKQGKLKTMSLRPHFAVGRGMDGEVEYTIVADMMGRTFTIRNKNDEVICQVSKTTKALIQTQVFGSGSESTVDIAPGVDCSTILAIVYGIGAVGNHFVADAFNNFVAEPLKDSITDSVIEGAGLQGAANQYTQASNSATHHASKLHKTAKFFNDTFFK